MDYFKIKRCLCVSLLISTVGGCTGCVSIYHAGGDDSPDGRYVIFGHVRGAGGRAFDDETWKTVFITIETNTNEKATIVTNYQNGAIVSETVVAVNGKTEMPLQKPLLEKKYHVYGSDVCWDAIWGKDDNITVFLYDYGPGVYWEDARKNGTPKRGIRTLHYVLDSESGRFLDQSFK